VLIRGARPVPLGAGAVHHPVDIRITGGMVREIGAGLRPDRGGRVLDADGRWAAPGLWDQHVHLAQWAQVRGRLDLAGAASAEEVLRRVAAHVAALPPGAAVVCGFGHRTATWPAPPTVAALDAVSGDRPVVLVSGDAHSGWLNSRALALLGVPPRSGPLEETDWFTVFPRLAELPGPRPDPDTGYRAVVADAAAAGIVGVTDFEFGPGHRDWPARFARGIDALRVRVAVYPEHLDDVLAAGLRTGQALPGGDGLLTTGPLKVISDGSLNTRTAHCCEPYADSAGFGRQNVPPGELAALLRRAHTAGLTAAVHAIGDAAVAIALDAFAATGATGSVEHAQLMRRADIPRMARLGLRASVQPAHLLDDRDVTARCWPDRADRCFPLRSLLDAGVPLALGSDAPVAPLDPWLAMAAAVHRSGDDREPWNPAESLTARQALAASTDGHTVLAPGGPGDVVLLDDDPLRAVGDPGDTAAVAAHLRGMRVAATLVAGRVTHLAL
jgi:predicted amidohydrolase YtcJ